MGPVLSPATPRAAVCGAGAARYRDHGGPGGARESRSETEHTETATAVKAY